MASNQEEVIARKALVVDANILIRAVLGRRVRDLLETYCDTTIFYTAKESVEDARIWVPRLLAEQRKPIEPGVAVLANVENFVESIDAALYSDFEHEARARIAVRDADDWPVVATALLLKAPIWTEDSDFFGSGIATWTTDRVHVYLAGA